MFTPSQYSGQPDQDYPLLHKQLIALIEGEPNLIANLANASALLWQGLKDINWAGFYLMDESKEELVLGPFQGLPACIRIPLGRGVCGTPPRSGELSSYRTFTPSRAILPATRHPVPRSSSR